MTLDFEDRLWERLEAAAERQERRGRVARRTAVARTVLPRPRTVLATLATLAVLGLAAVTALNQSAPPVTPTPPRIDSFQVARALTGAAGGFGSLWTYDPLAHVVLRVDPAGKRVLARVPVPAPWPDVSLAASDDAVWAVSTHDVGHDAAPAHPAAATLFRIDPQTNRIAARITLRAPNGATLIPLGVTVTSSAAWVWGEGGAQRIDPATNRITTAISVPGARIKAFAADETEAWASTDLGDLVRFNARTGQRLSTAPVYALGRPQQPILLSGALLLDRQDGSIVAVDATTGATRWTARPGTALRGAAVADSRLWLLDTEALVAIDPGDGRIAAHVALPTSTPLAVATVDSTLLVTTADGYVIRFRP